jgi:hypothetical protein
MNNPMDGLEVKVFDPARETISLSHQGRLVTLTLKQSRIIVQAPTLSVSAPSKDADQGPPAAVTSEDRRKQMVAAEIQRRRTLRAGATAATR